MQRKQNTSRGFKPNLHISKEITVPDRDALRLDGRLDVGVLSPALHRLLLSMARVRNVVSSLNLEGKGIHLDDARRAVESGRPTTANDEAVLRFAEEYARIHEWTSSQVPEPSVGLICSLHSRLLAGDPDIPQEDLGQLKSRQNGLIEASTGMMRFEATPPERTTAELESLFEWYKENRDLLPRLAVAAIYFAEFQAIHPFHDGNGRIGRVLNMMALKQLGFQNIALVPIDGRFFRTSDKYYEKLASTNDGVTWHVWARYYARQVLRAYEIAQRRADLRPILDQQTSNSTRRVMEWVLQGDGTWFKHSDYPNTEGLSPASVTGAFRTLVEEGVLEGRGETRGREYRLSTRFLQQIYSSEFMGNPGDPRPT
jgi:Fic family protein